MPRPIQALIHQEALRHNLSVVRRHAQGARVWAVVKADAYGHGIAHVYPALAGADGFALIDLAEAEQLRALGWAGPILLLEGVFSPEDVAACARLDLWHVVHCPAQIDMLAASIGSARQHVFLKLNSGMNRLGFAPAAYGHAWARLRALAQVGEISLMTHFSDADGPLGITRQLATFEAATQGLPGARSVANSAATLRHGSVVHAQAGWVRAGVALYGGVPDFPEHASAYWNLQPAMSLRTRIIAVQTLQAGDTVGYGSRFVAGEPMTVGIAACGYADGYPRACASGTPVLVDGVPSRTVGRVSMDMLCVDLTPVRRAGRRGDYGSEVVLWGRASAALGGAVQPVDAVAHAAGTIGYELMCAVARRVPIAAADASA